MNFRSSYKAISTIGGHKIFKTWKKPVRIWIRGVSALECGHRVVQNQKIIATDGYLIFPSDESSYSVIFSDFAISACTDDPYRIAVGKTHKSGASNIPPNIHVFLRYQRCIAIAFAWCETRFHCSAGPKCVSTILYGWSVHHKPSRIHGKLARMTSDYFANQIRRHSKCFGYARSTPWLRKKSRMRARLHCSPDSKCIQRFCTDHPHREAVAKSVKMLSEFPNFMKHVLRCQYSTSLTFTRVWDSILLLYRSKMYASFLYGWSVHTGNHKMKLNQRKWIRWTRIVSQIK